MDRIAQELGLRAADLILLGVLLAQWMNGRARRDQGRRLGAVEKELAKVLTARVASRSDDG